MLQRIKSAMGFQKKYIIIICLIIHLIVSPLNKNEALILASSLEQQEQYQEAQKILEQLWVEYPHDLEIIYKLGCFYSAIGNIACALSTFKSILNISPENNIQTMYNIGYVLKTAGHIDQAIDCYAHCLALDPEYEAASFAIGIAHLYKGDFEKGWQHHEKHLKKTHKNADELRKFLRTQTLKDKTILLRPDGGMGDVIQFIRYAQLLKAQGARVLAAVHKPLVPLLSRCPFLDQVVSMNDSLPLCHEWCAVMSLPAVFHSTQETIPRDIPYLFPDQLLSTHWKEFVQGKTQQGQKSTNKICNIGICWQADVHNDSSRPAFARRGMPLKHFFKLANISGTQFYSLQQKDGLDQLNNIPSDFNLTVFDETFDVAHGAFMDTAALIKHLDIVITVDTAVAHIAGALGARVWLLLPYCTDWRWISNRIDSPWYPSMRIFKQKKAFDWESVMDEVETELKKIISETFI